MTETQSVTHPPFETSPVTQPTRLIHPPHGGPHSAVPSPHLLRLHEPSHLRRAPEHAEPPEHAIREHAAGVPSQGRSLAGSEINRGGLATSATDQAAEDIVDGVLKAAHRLRGLLSGHFSEFDLTDVRYAVLKFLRDSEPYGCTQAEIAEHLDQSESSISTLVKRMRKSELLYRLRSGIDKRKWVLKLTERGSNLLETARRHHAQRMDGFLRAFDSEERLNLSGMLGKLVTELCPRDSQSTGAASAADEPAAGAAEASCSAPPVAPRAIGDDTPAFPAA